MNIDDECRMNMYEYIIYWIYWICMNLLSILEDYEDYNLRLDTKLQMVLVCVQSIWFYQGAPGENGQQESSKNKTPGPSGALTEACDGGLLELVPTSLDMMRSQRLQVIKAKFKEWIPHSLALLGYLYGYFGWPDVNGDICAGPKRGWCHQFQGLGMGWSFPVLTSGVDIEGDPASYDVSERHPETGHIII